ncbi:hypothetical protein JOE68_005419 [Saccharothrix algeriensis]|uniref:Uncharacterized protein n=1 Tax=Saccharothrix algeriensis TaxID=173560 RepID=A0ABS2SE88_9PSEU|nr:hypothetical protein [Saccharothrix algeriensis]
MHGPREGGGHTGVRYLRDRGPDTTAADPRSSTGTRNLLNTVPGGSPTSAGWR